MFSVVKKYLHATIAAFLFFAGVFLYNKGRRDQKDKLSRDNLDAMREAKDIRDEIQNDHFFVDRAEKWVKPD